MTERSSNIETASPPGLIPTGQAANLAGVSRQAVLIAAKKGRLPMAGRNDRGGLLFDPKEVVAWASAGTRMRTPATPTPGGREADQGGGFPETERPTRAAGVRSLLASPTASFGAIPKAFLDGLVERVLAPDLVEGFRKLVAQDLENRQKATALDSDRIDFERSKLELERRRLDRSRNAEERDANARQVRRRVIAAVSRRTGWTPNLVANIQPAMDRMLELLGDDLLALTVRAGAAVEDALLGILPEFNTWARRSKLMLPEPAATEELARRWARDLESRRRAAAGTPAPPAPPTSK